MAFQGYKFTMLFNTATKQGFSESWYWASNTPISALDLAPFNNMAVIRDNLCATGVNLVGWRLSDVQDPRKVYAKRIPVLAPADNPQDPTSTAILAIAYGANGVGRRQFWMRGVRDSWVQWNIAQNRWDTVGSFTTPFNDFSNAITSNANSWRLKTFERLKDSSSKQKVSALTTNSGGFASLALQSVAGFSATSTIIVSGFRRPLNRLNGTYLPGTWDAFTSPSASITLGTRQIPASWGGLYGTGAYVRLQVPDMTPITHIELGEPRSRRVGRAFFVPVGRRRR